MNSGEFSGPQAQPVSFPSTLEPTQTAAAGVSAGYLLKSAREAAGLHIAALAAMLKVPVKRLEALETNRLDLLPDAVFVRALAASVCRTLKIESSTVLELLPQSDAPKFTRQRASANAPFRSPADGSQRSVWLYVSRPSLLAGLALLLGALVLVFLPLVTTSVDQIRSGLMSAGITQPAEKTSENPSATAVPSTNLPDSPPGGAARSDAANSAAATPIAAADTSLPASTATPGLGVTESQQTTQPVNKLPLATDLIVFTAKAQTWIKVTDSKGLTVLRRTLAAGEIVGVSGVVPLSVIVGSANATEVQIRGNSFDLNAVAKNNVARFEVK